VPALGADRARDAHLRAAFGGEHHEDQEDQQDAGGDGERAEGGEQRQEGVALLVGQIEAVLFQCRDLQARALEGRRQEVDHLVGVAGARHLAAAVREQHV
jgi:hypothetical protein